MKLTKKEQEARKRVCLALDVPTVREALSLANELSDYVGLFKVGKQLHTTAGTEPIDIIGRIYATNHERSGNVFLDLKLHDTPNTVYEASGACTVPGVSFFNIHIGGGEEMCKKALEGASKASQAQHFLRKGILTPAVIGVTVLTSLDDDDLAVQGLGIKYDDLVRRRTELAREWGLAGIVCPANKAGALEKEFGSDFLYVTPGIKWAGKQGAGQKQLYTPDKAVQDSSSSILVIGSAIIGAGNKYRKEEGKKILVEKGTMEDKKATAYEILQAMAKQL